jgi:hypothetical protein
MKDFFVSYTGQDRTWPEWLAWVLEEAGYIVMTQAWEFRPGGNFALDMQRATMEAKGRSPCSHPSTSINRFLNQSGQLRLLKIPPALIASSPLYSNGEILVVKDEKLMDKGFLSVGLIAA